LSIPRVAVRLPLLVLLLSLLGFGPCGPVPGGSLSGEIVEDRVEDWSFANDVPRCAVEVRPEAPHSVTTNCMAWQGRLFVSCSKCAFKKWAEIALEEPRGRIRVGEQVYPVQMTRVERPLELDGVWMARANKLGSNEMEPRPGDWWTFEMVSRRTESLE
jgi:hypothetical protein